MIAGYFIPVLPSGTGLCGRARAVKDVSEPGSLSEPWFLGFYDGHDDCGLLYPGFWRKILKKGRDKHSCWVYDLIINYLNFYFITFYTLLMRFWCAFYTLLMRFSSNFIHFFGHLCYRLFEMDHATGYWFLMAFLGSRRLISPIDVSFLRRCEWKMERFG